MKNGYDDIYGTWDVTTEGDCEGRSTKDLGRFIGYVDEIALRLASKAYYGLCFKKVTPDKKEDHIPTDVSVNVLFSIDSGTWDTIKKDGGIHEIKEAFKDRPVVISESSYHASFTISLKDSESFLKAQALSKLSEKEKAILGLSCG